MLFGLIALSCGVVAPVAFITHKLRRPVPRLAHYTKMCLPEAPMRRLVHLECLRAERNGAPLSMVVFPVGTDELGATVEFLEKALPEKIRLADAAGWIGDAEMAVVLPETGLAGARAFVELLRKQLQRGRAMPSFTIFGFDHKWIAESEKPAARPSEPVKLAMSA